MALLQCLACTQTTTRSFGIEVKRGATLEEKLGIAKGIVTEERFAHLKEQLKAKFPSLTEAQLSQMGLQWRENHFTPFGGGQAQTNVLVVVVMVEQPGVDAVAVVQAAADLLEPEINGTLPKATAEPALNIGRQDA
jgi:hypothetical protein